MRIWALLLTVLLLLPRVALGAIVLHCGDPWRTRSSCCCDHEAKPEPKHERTLERADCCTAQAANDQAPLPAAPGSDLKLPVLALSVASSESFIPAVADIQEERRPAQARAPPPPRVPLFLKNRALLH